MTAVLQLVPPVDDDDKAADAAVGRQRDPEVYRDGLASARAALREGTSRRFRHERTVGTVDGVPRTGEDRSE